MLVGQAIRELEQRRQLLLAQSGLHRATLALQLTTAAGSLRWLDAGVRLGQRAGTWLLALAPFAGFLFARKSLRLWDVALRSLPLARAILRVFRR